MRPFAAILVCHEQVFLDDNFSYLLPNPNPNPIRCVRCAFACYTLFVTSLKVMQDDQKLMVEFQDYPNVLIRMLNNCIKEPHSHLAVFVMQHDVNARLDFIQVRSLSRGMIDKLKCSNSRILRILPGIEGCQRQNAKRMTIGQTAK